MNKEDLKKKIEEEQKILNEQFEKDGLTDEILDKQIELNKLRNEYNLTDETEIIYDKYVQ